MDKTRTVFNSRGNSRRYFFGRGPWFYSRGPLPDEFFSSTRGLVLPIARFGGCGVVHDSARTLGEPFARRGALQGPEFVMLVCRNPGELNASVRAA